MSHKTEVIKMQQVSDEALAVTIRCCGNKLTDSVLTLHGMSEEQLASGIDKHHDRVAAKHAGMESGKALLEGTIPKTKVHGLLPNRLTPEENAVEAARWVKSYQDTGKPPEDKK